MKNIMLLSLVAIAFFSCNDGKEVKEEHEWCKCMDEHLEFLVSNRKQGYKDTSTWVESSNCKNAFDEMIRRGGKPFLECQNGKEYESEMVKAMEHVMNKHGL